jgi:hypothetical protein
LPRTRWRRRGEKPRSWRPSCFFALAYGIQIPIGGITYVIWRVKSDWRRPADAAAQRERATELAIQSQSW